MGGQPLPQFERSGPPWLFVGQPTWGMGERAPKRSYDCIMINLDNRTGFVMVKSKGLLPFLRTVRLEALDGQGVSVDLVEATVLVRERRYPHYMLTASCFDGAFLGGPASAVRVPIDFVSIDLAVLPCDLHQVRSPGWPVALRADSGSWVHGGQNRVWAERPDPRHGSPPSPRSARPRLNTKEPRCPGATFGPPEFGQ